MKSQSIVLFCLTIILATLVIGAGAADVDNTQAALPRKVQWEHLAVPHDSTSFVGQRGLAEKINKLGDDGWELVDVETLASDGSSGSLLFFFKRQK